MSKIGTNLIFCGEYYFFVSYTGCTDVVALVLLVMGDTVKIAEGGSYPRNDRVGY